MTDTGLQRLVWITAQLREYCPWTQDLTHHQLTEYLIEEAYEAVEVIESVPARRWDDSAVEDGTYEEFRKELGDVLFQVTLHSAIAEQAGAFTVDDVADAISDKMLRRNPHVFDADGHLLPVDQLGEVTVDDVEKNWERIKQTEKSDEGGAEDVARSSIYDLPPGLPALAAAAKIVDRAGRQAQDPLGQPPAETSAAVEVSGDEVGAQLFQLVRVARASGVDLEAELRQYLNQLGR
jgi:XTP/dITP diphosphohydrolase